MAIREAFRGAFRGAIRGAYRGLSMDEQAKAKPHTFFAHGVPGIKRAGNMVDEEFLQDLKGSKGAKVYREMQDNHAVIGSGLWVTEMMLSRTKWAVEPANDSQEAEAARLYCEQCIEDMEGGMRGFVSEMLTAAPFGWAWMEKLYKIRRGPDYKAPQLNSKYTDGRIGIRRIALVAQETLYEWLWNEDDEVIAMVQQAPPPHSGMRVIPRDKAVHVRFKYTKNNPEGKSILRTAYPSYYRQKNFEFVESVGIERNLAGYPAMFLPPALLESQDPAHKQTVQRYYDIVRKIKADEFQGIVLPSADDMDGKTGFDFKLMSSGGNKPADIDPVIRRLDSRIAMTLLAEFLVVGLDKVGSFSLHSDKTSLFATALGTYLDERDRVFSENVFPELMRLNGMPAELAPYMTHGDIEKIDLQVLGSFLQSITSSGVVTVDDRLEEWVREQAGLPEVDTETARAAPMSSLPMEDTL